MTQGWAEFEFITFPTTSRCATVAGILILLGIKKDHITSYLPKLSTRSSPRLCGAKTSTRRLKKVDTVNTENGWRDKFTILKRKKKQERSYYSYNFLNINMQIISTKFIKQIVKYTMILLLFSREATL